MRTRLASSRLSRLARLAAAAGLTWAVAASAAPPSLAAPAAVEWPNIYLTLVASGFFRPVHVTHAGDGSNRLFVVEQHGVIKIIENGLTLGTPLLDISSTGADRVKFSDGEEGLLSVAFPPGFGWPDNPRFYVYYTSEEGALDGDNVVARYELESENVADPDSEEIVLVLEHPTYGNHNGGQLAFGPNDGYLYIGTGDGGSGDDPDENGQDINEWLGKILRIEVEDGNPPTYTAPADNPFVGDDGLDEIWDYGLRNPWRFSFDRDTYDLYIGDVGQAHWEEIDFEPAPSLGGVNYGWDCYEAEEAHELAGCGDISNYEFPVASYVNPTMPDDCRSVTGGFVYRGSVYEKMQGIYFYGDFCTGQIWGLKHDGVDWQTEELEDWNDFAISSFGEDEAGELYVAHRSAGQIYRLSADDNFYYLPFAAKN
jgi:glucose/arabinose dehydrogenase